MPRVVFTPNLLRHLDCPPTRTEGNSVREALEAVFVQHHQLRGYIVDDQSHLRQHVNIFVDGQPIVNRFTSLKQVPASTPLAEKLSKDLKKRGFRFVGPTIVYAHMQATGMVNDHLVGCHRHKVCAALR